jgi:hypothetical protein
MHADKSRHLAHRVTHEPPTRALRVGHCAPVLRSAIALAALLVVIQGPAARSQAQEFKPPLDPAAVKSRLVVRTVKSENRTRQVVVLGKPTGTTGIPDIAPLCRLDMLPRELLRQAVLIAARDELGLSTRDQVIDDTSAEGPNGGSDPVIWYRYLAKDALAKLETK